MPDGTSIDQTPGLESIDITHPSGPVIVEWDRKRHVLYVHAEGRTILRMCRVEEFQFIASSTGG